MGWEGNNPGKNGLYTSENFHHQVLDGYLVIWADIYFYYSNIYAHSVKCNKSGTTQCTVTTLCGTEFIKKMRSNPHPIICICWCNCGGMVILASQCIAIPFTVHKCVAKTFVTSHNPLPPPQQWSVDGGETRQTGQSRRLMNFIRALTTTAARP